MGKKRLPKIENVEIVDISAKGKAVGKVNEKVIFIPFAVPGDIVDVQVTKKRSSYFEGNIIAYKKKSDLRIQPRCKHFGVCGGCKWQNLSYNDQLRFKQKQVISNLQKISGKEIPESMPIMGSENQFFYRNKLEFSFSNKKWLTDYNKEITFEERNMNGLGFHMPGMFDRILDIDECFLQPEPSNAIRLFIRDFALNNGLGFYDPRNHEGLLRNLIIRNSSREEWMMILVAGEDDKENIERILTKTVQEFPQLISVYYTINQKVNDTIYDLDLHLFHGQEFISETMEELTFQISPKSFFQTNTLQSLELYKVVRDFAGLTGKEIVYDLYTGTGTIANFIARDAKKVVGIDAVADAIIDAIKNAGINGIDNTGFYAGDILKLLNSDFIKKNGNPDVIISDPPRAGMHPKVIQQINRVRPLRIVYVSCNAATQARDISMLDDVYKVLAVQPVDMFPHTHHVENVLLMERIN